MRNIILPCATYPAVQYFPTLSQHILKKIINIKFRENPSRGSGAVSCGRRDRQTDRQIDMTKLVVAFRYFASHTKNHKWWNVFLEITEVKSWPVLRNPLQDCILYRPYQLETARRPASPLIKTTRNSNHERLPQPAMYNAYPLVTAHYPNPSLHKAKHLLLPSAKCKHSNR